MSMCSRVYYTCSRVYYSLKIITLVLLEEGVCYEKYVLLAKLCLPLSCFILYSKVKFTCYSRYLVNSFLCIPVPYIEKNIFFSVLVLEGLVGHHRTVQLQLVQHYWSEHRLAILWYWMVCHGNEQRSFCHFWDWIQVLHLGLLLSVMATPFVLRGSCPQW